jgi:hypothetical protein
MITRRGLLGGLTLAPLARPARTRKDEHMAEYQYLGPARGGPNTAAPDQTGLNTGQLTNALTGSFIGMNVPQFECYHMTVRNVPGGGSATINVNSDLYSFTYPNLGAEWDPSQPLFLRPGDEIDFLWNIAVGGQAPIVTAYFRFDITLPVNKPFVTQG